MTGGNLNQIRHTLERAEFLLQSPYGLTVEKLMIDMSFGTTEHCNDVIELCDSQCLIEIEQTNYSTAHVKSVTPLGKMVLVALKTRIDEFEDRCQSIEAQLERTILAVQQGQTVIPKTDGQFERAPAIIPPVPPTRDMFRGPRS